MTSENRNGLPAGIYRQLFEHAADPLFVLDVEGNFIEVNQAACDHVGYSRDELLCMRPEYINDAFSQEKIPGRMARLNSEHEATFEAVHVHRNGAHIPVEMHIRWIEGEGKIYSLNICRDITERKQRELGYQTIVQTTTDGFWIVSADDARTLEVNDAYCWMVGYTRDELLSMHISDLESVESPEDTKAHIRKVIETGHDFFETKHRHKDGHTVEVEISVTYSSLRGGIFFAFVRDISGRKNTEKKLTSTLKELESIIQVNPDILYVINPDGKLIKWNQTLEKLCGLTPEQMMNRPAVEFVCEEDRPTVVKGIAEVFEKGSASIEVRFIRHDGALVTHLCNGAVWKNPDGDMMGFVGVGKDITERKQMETALRDSEERFRKVYENAPVGIAMAGEGQKIFMANADYCRMFGYSPEELRHLTISDLTHPDYRHQTRQKAAAVLDGTLPSYSFEKKYLRKDGGTFWGRITATEVTSGTTGKHYIMGLVEDVTERVEREERRLAEAREQKDILVREVHHRIKNSLQGVVGLLRQYATDHPEVAGVIDGAVGKIYSIAAIHGLQAQKLSEAVNLVFLMEQLVSLSECPIELSNGLSCPVILGKDEAVPIALILNELVTNACKHRSARHPIIVNLSGSATGVAVTVANHFEGNGGKTVGQGSGLRLIESLLPRKHTSLEFKQEDGIFSASLELSPPIVASEK